MSFWRKEAKKRRHDIQYNDTQQNDTHLMSASIIIDTWWVPA